MIDCESCAQLSCRLHKYIWDKFVLMQAALMFVLHTKCIVSYIVQLQASDFRVAVRLGACGTLPTLLQRLL